MHWGLFVVEHDIHSQIKLRLLGGGALFLVFGFVREPGRIAGGGYLALASLFTSLHLSGRDEEVLLASSPMEDGVLSLFSKKVTLSIGPPPPWSAVFHLSLGGGVFFFFSKTNYNRVLPHFFVRWCSLTCLTFLKGIQKATSTKLRFPVGGGALSCLLFQFQISAPRSIFFSWVVVLSPFLCF